MYRNRLKEVIVGLLLVTTMGIVLGLKKAPEQTALVWTIAYFKTNAGVFSASADRLHTAIVQMDGSSYATGRAKLALKECRMNYKKISFFLDYFFESSALLYNRPPKVEVEEPYMEYQEPAGLQVIEGLLYEEQPILHKEDLQAQAELISSSAKDLGTLIYQFNATESEILESLDLELVRVMALSISGYDAPELKSGIEEANVSLKAISAVLQPFLKADEASVQLSQGLNKALQSTAGTPDFDAFDRMAFLKEDAIPLQRALRHFISVRQLIINPKSAMSRGAAHLFSRDAIDPVKFPGGNIRSSAKIVALGKKLFTEKSLSGKMKRSCASCHEPGRAFTDGLKTSLAFDGVHHVARNAPSLFYVAYQYAQFWDGRAKSLNEQILQVIRNPMEMNADPEEVVRKLQKDPTYSTAFAQAFETHGALTTTQLTTALAAYIQTLSPFNSLFDQYLAGNVEAMNQQQIRGFNVFMGKAQCGTCHFIPLFNGLIPPLYKRTEFEILGTPANDDLKHPLIDKDQGRADFFSIEYYNGAFKTPSLRNAALTAPYMHNGVFKDLEQLMEFYNQGGGNGIGLKLSNQTLPSKPLHLTPAEVKEVILFIESLTDQKQSFK